MNGRKVQAFVKITRTGGPITSKSDINPGLLSDFKGKCESCTRRDPGSHRTVMVGRDAVLPDVSKEQAKFAAVRRWYIAAQPSGNNVFRLDAT